MLRSRILAASVLLAVVCVAFATAQKQPDASAPSKLSEVELLRGQKALLRIQVIDARYRIDRQQAETEFNAARDEVLKAHDITLESHQINWDTGELTPAPESKGGP